MASKKKSKGKRGKRGKSPRLLLRAAIEDMEHGQCGNAVVNLVAAAKKAPSRGKMKHHLDAVTSTFVKQCLRGGGGFNVPPSMRQPARPDPYAKLYKHAGPKGRLPGARSHVAPPAPVHQGIPPLRFGPSEPTYHGPPAPVPYAPGTNTIPSLRGLGRHRRGR